MVLQRHDQLSAIDNSSSDKTSFLVFKSYFEIELTKLLTRISTQDHIINSNKQKDDRRITENLHLKSRTAKLENEVPFQRQPWEGFLEAIIIP